MYTFLFSLPLFYITDSRIVVTPATAPGSSNRGERADRGVTRTGRGGGATRTAWRCGEDGDGGDGGGEPSNHYIGSPARARRDEGPGGSGRRDSGGDRKPRHLSARQLKPPEEFDGNISRFKDWRDSFRGLFISQHDNIPWVKILDGI